MSLCTIDDVLTAFAQAWPSTGTFAGVKLSAHAKQPGDTATNWAVITCIESQDPRTESDGNAEQQFRVEVTVYSSANPPPTASFSAGLVLLYDGTPAAPGAGLTLPGSGQTVTLVKPVASQTKHGDRRAGVAVLAASRAWSVTTNASQT